MPFGAIGWLIIVVAGGLGLYGLHRFCLWLEEEGLIFYLYKKPSGSGLGNAALELDRLLTRPSVEHHVVCDYEQIVVKENDGK
jgi:hypothetical protein